MITFGHAFNAIAEPVGRSISNINMAPYRVGRVLIQYAAQFPSGISVGLIKRHYIGIWCFADGTGHAVDTLAVKIIEVEFRIARNQFQRGHHRRLHIICVIAH